MSSSTSKTLPSFGIRELHGPEDHGFVQITAPQYESTLKSYPSAALMYLDEDDGETVHVGSGLELEQRLDEPVPTRRLARRMTNSVPHSPSGDQKIHLFDIQRTANNLQVWRDHAAYSSKTLRDSPSPVPLQSTELVQPGQSSRTVAENVPTALSFTVPTAAVSPCSDSEPARASVPSRTDTSSDVLKDIDNVLQTACQGLESHIGGFAAFLDLTAGALRTAAEKTREADTTPVENFLSGMKNVLVEAGQMGVELLRELDTESRTPSRSRSAEAGSVKETAAPQSPHTVSESESLSKRVSFNTLESIMTNQTRQPTVSTLKASDQKLEDLGVQHEDKTEPALGHNSLDIQSQADSVMPAQPGDKADRSLMDMEASNADFAARFPPLTSLKRAKTIGSLRQESSKNEAEGSSGGANSALRRYPTIGQFEEGKRSETKSRLSLAMARRLRLHQQQAVRGYKSPSVEDTSDSDDKAQSKKAAEPVKAASPKETSESVLPGAWPEKSSAILDADGSESSGDFFNRMARFTAMEPDHGRSRSPALSCRNTSPLNDPFHPSVGALRRAQTVTASNPAARLNGPFDPMSGAPGPRDGPNARNIARPAQQTNLPRRSLTQHQSTHALRPTARPAPIPQQSTLWNNFPHPSQTPMLHRPAPWTQHGQRPPMPGAFPYPPVPQPRPAPSNDHFLRHMRSEPQFSTSAPRPTTDPGVSECIRSLRAMGYGLTDPNEDARLPMVSPLPSPPFPNLLYDCITDSDFQYASATFGNVSEAIEMIEEDKRAAKAIMSRV